MSRPVRLLLVLLAALVALPVTAAQASRSTGPVLERWGPVLDDVEVDYLPLPAAYRVAFDVWIGPDEPDVLNPRLETLARFMNYNARLGVPVEDMQLAVVLHGSAGRAVLENDAYRSRFGVDNPDLALMAALAERGVRFLICGQSAAHRGYTRAEMVEPVRVAASAYTALSGLQAEGYQLMPSWE
jgi:intracellular sulfur oxidation DsrE/DsrF family protein